MARKGRKPAINGTWLAEAIEANGETLSSAAKLIGIDSRLLYGHKSGRISISTNILFALCSAMPMLSERYVLTGRGPKQLPVVKTDDDLLLEAFQIKKSIERLIEKLTA